MPRVTDPRLTATARLLAALNQQPLRQIEQRRPPVVINPGQPQRALGLLQPSVEQIRTPLPQVQGGLLQPQGGGQSVQPPPQPSALGQVGQLALGQLTKAGLSKAAEVAGIPSLGEVGSSIASAFGFGAAPTIGTAAGNAAAASSALAAGAASPIGGPLSAIPVAGTFGGGLPVAAAAFAPTAGLIGAGLLAAITIRALTKGSRPSTTSVIGIDAKSGRPRVTDADAKGDLTSDDASAVGNAAIFQLDKIRRELGGTFKNDRGNFGVVTSSGRGFDVQDSGRLKSKTNPETLGGRFRDPDDAFKAFSLLALRDGAIDAPQDKIDAKIRELSEVFARDTAVTDFGVPDSLGGPDDNIPTPQAFFDKLSPVQQNILNAQRTGRLDEIFLSGRKFERLKALAPDPNLTPFQIANSRRPVFQGGDFSDRADFAAGLGPQPFIPGPDFDFFSPASPGFLQPDLGVASV